MDDISRLYDALHQNSLKLQNIGVEENNLEALMAARESVDRILGYSIRNLFEIPESVDIPVNILELVGLSSFEQAIEMHIKNPREDSFPQFSKENENEYTEIARQLGWEKYWRLNKPITLMMAKRVKDAIRLFLLKETKPINLDPNFEENSYYGIRRFNDSTGAKRPGFRSSGGKIKG